MRSTYEKKLEEQIEKLKKQLEDAEIEIDARDSTVDLINRALTKFIKFVEEISNFYDGREIIKKWNFFIDCARKEKEKKND